jgi:response regulator RpfG family c-di-GMP phosphodiesterase
MESSFSTARILIVDDEPAVCGLLKEALSFEGYDCQTRSNGKEALEALRLQPFDVVLTDLNMPGMSGLELLDAGRAMSPHSTFVMATAESDVRVGIQAMKQGAADYLVKPLQIESVRSSVERALKSKRLEIDIERHNRELERLVEERTRQLYSAVERVEQTYDETLEVLGAALDARDDETAGHAVRVTRYCLEIARAMGCTEDQLNQIARGSYLHDVGKIGIPDAILLKQGKLSVQERSVMQAHVQIGYDLVSRAAFMSNAAEIVLAHHERYDGTGYPRGLKTEDIPLGARIFAVADTLDAMTSDRPYRRAFPFSVARAEIENQATHQFDPRVVQAFLSIPQSVWEDIRREVAALRGKGVHDVPKLSMIWHRWGHRQPAMV